jgi:hypothetical protein
MADQTQIIFVATRTGDSYQEIRYSEAKELFNQGQIGPEQSVWCAKTNAWVAAQVFFSRLKRTAQLLLGQAGIAPKTSSIKLAAPKPAADQSRRSPAPSSSSGVPVKAAVNANAATRANTPEAAPARRRMVSPFSVLMWFFPALFVIGCVGGVVYQATVYRSHEAELAGTGLAFRAGIDFRNLVVTLDTPKDGRWDGETLVEKLHEISRKVPYNALGGDFGSVRIRNGAGGGFYIDGQTWGRLGRTAAGEPVHTFLSQGVFDMNGNYYSVTLRNSGSLSMLPYRSLDEAARDLNK